MIRSRAGFAYWHGGKVRHLWFRLTAGVGAQGAERAARSPPADCAPPSAACGAGESMSHDLLRRRGGKGAGS